MKAADREIRAARAYSDSIIDTIRQPLVVLDDRLRFVSANRSFYDMFALEPGEAIGKPLETVAGRHGGAPGLRSFLEQVQAEPSHVDDYEIELDLTSGRGRILLLNARKLLEGSLGERKTLIAIDDITERRRAAEALGDAKREAEQAVKYTETGRVLLGCRRSGDKLRWDTGIGIPAEQLSAIFEEFRQLDNPARERSKGLGLGLVIVQRLADLLGHAIDARSRPSRRKRTRDLCRG